ncbi:MAG: UDP-3-O-(3-hydroxymyristoyl)glucosamine N-acyltransferase [Planctomycetota bacterium]|nr:UDP-3-O-(3-hydroxymyristoyl)glucosamine N-acyltransferase [Planctomycetota bacterium]
MQIKLPQPLPLAAIAEILEGSVQGDGKIPIAGFAPPEAAAAGDLTFVLNPDAAERAAASAASAVVVPIGVKFADKASIAVENPRYALAMALRQFAPSVRPPSGAHASAVIADDARLGEEVSIGPLVMIGAKSTVGDRTSVGAGSIVEGDVVIGSDSTIHSNVTICRGSRIGSRVEIHPGTVIGSDGFGYVQKGAVPGTVKGYKRYFQKQEPHLKIPQIGNVIIEDDVEIGANVAVDRGTIGPTRILKGAKVDNLVQIAHNVTVGEHALVISQVGISGSARIGKHATLGGQAGISEGTEVGEGALVAAQCGLPPGKKVAPGMAFVGTPGRPAKQFRRIAAATAVLPRAVKRLRALEKELRELKKSIRSRRPD